jgi:hypothetical protein
MYVGHHVFKVRVDLWSLLTNIGVYYKNFGKNVKFEIEVVPVRWEPRYSLQTDARADMTALIAAPCIANAPEM